MMYSNIGLTCRETLPLKGLSLVKAKVGTALYAEVDRVSIAPDGLPTSCSHLRGVKVCAAKNIIAPNYRGGWVRCSTSLCVICGLVFYYACRHDTHM